MVKKINYSDYDLKILKKFGDRIINYHKCNNPSISFTDENTFGLFIGYVLIEMYDLDVKTLA